MGNIKGKAEKSKISTYEKHTYLNFATSCMRGWRPFMQDAHLAIYPLAGQQDMGLFAVFDGHGGPEVSNFAKENFAKCLISNAFFQKRDYQNALTQAFLQLDDLMTTKLGHQQLTALRAQNASRNNATYYDGQTIAGSTAIVILVTKDFVYCANAGDSKAIAAVFTNANKLEVTDLSFQHKPLHPKEKKRIHNAGGIVTNEGRINNNLNLSRAFGDFIFKNNKNLSPQQQMVIAVPDVCKLARSHIKFIMLGCDGIWEKKSSMKMMKFVTKKYEPDQGNLAKILQLLFDQQVASNSFEELGMDNMTAILIEFNRKAHKL